MSISTDFRLDDASLSQAQAAFAALPEQFTRARERAYRQIGTWMQRQLLITASQASGIPPATFAALRRIQQRTITTPDGTPALRWWIGTNPAQAAHFGATSWCRNTNGATVSGKGTLPGTWYWPTGPTARAVMRRKGTFGRLGNPTLEQIQSVMLPVDAQIRSALEQLIPEATARFAAYLRQELADILTVERSQ